MSAPLTDDMDLAQQNAELRLQLQEAQETLAAIQSGDVDALVVGADIYTLDTSNAAANKLRQDVLSQMGDAVLAFDARDHVVFMNAAAEQLYGKDSSATLGRPRLELFEEIWADDAAQQAFNDALQRDGTCQAAAVHRIGGTSLHVESRCSRMRNAAGESIGTLCVIRDISARVAAERALEEASRQKDEFLATLAHELRNPLAPIRNSLQMMRMSATPAAQDKARGIIERQVVHMVHLVDDLLDVSRISQGKIQLRIEHADLNGIVQTAIETSRPLIDAGHHTLAVQLPPPGTLLVDADATRLSQVVSNLLNNAAKYTPPQGQISVTASREGEQAVIVVRDSGVGIAPQSLPKVFDLFTQIDRSMEHSQGGLGIGLALVKRLVDLHGGSAEASSAGPGQGSQFTVRLPLSASVAVVPQPAAHDSVHAADGLRVLVVDDNIDAAQTLAELLGMIGYDVRMAHDGEAALRAAEEFKPAAAVLDIGLPGLSGHEVARRIRQQPWGEHMLLLALSGWGQSEDRTHSAEAGFDRHFVKPVDFMELTNLLDEKVGSSAG